MRFATLAWSGLALLLLLLALAFHQAVDDQAREERDAARASSAQSLALAARVIGVDLQDGRYQAIQPYLEQWRRASPQLAEAAVVAANGAVLGRVGGDAPGADSERFEVRIPYSYRGEARLAIRVSFAGLVQHRQALRREALALYLLLSVLLALLVRFAVRQRADAVHVRDLNRTLTVLRRCNEALIRADDEAALLKSMCAVCVETGGYALAWIGYANPAPERPIALASAAGASAYLEGLTLSWSDTPIGQGPTGRAIRSGQPVWIRDTQSDASFAPWRGRAARHGLRSSIALPLGRGVPAMGVLCLYTAVANPFSPEELTLLEALAADISYGIEALRDRLALHESTQRLEQIATNLHEAFWMADLPDGRMLYVSRAFETIWQRPVAALYADTQLWEQTIHPDDRARVEQAYGQARGVCDYEQEYRIVRPDGSLRWIRERASPVRDAQGRIYRMAGSAQDITERRETERLLEHQAFHDQLTGLANRRLLLLHLEQALAAHGSDGRLLAVALCDLDRFRLVNDSRGREAGDALLRRVAERLRQRVPGEGLVARLDSDKFALVLPDQASVESCLHLLRGLQDVLAQPWPGEAVPTRLSCGLGVAFHPLDGDTGERLLAHAEAALLRAKQSGKGWIHAYATEHHRRISEQYRLEGDLPLALERGEFHLVYQAKVSARSGRIVGLEALIRWRHPELGLIPPDRFIPIAEDSEAIVEIGGWVMQTACKQLRAWQDAGLPRVPVSVNLSPQQFRDRLLLARVEGSLAGSGLAPGYLDLEITENVAMDESQARLDTVAQLKAMGIGISIDDFGTGYSSFKYLSRLRPDRLKIDRSFVDGLPGNATHATLASQIIALGHAFGIAVVAEGVETEAQLEFLRERGCDEIQGYLFCRPCDAATFAALLARGALVPAR